MLHFRNALPDDLETLQQLFVNTIHLVNQRDYSASQIAVWTASIENKQRWLDKIRQQYFLVAQKSHQVVGFASLEAGQYLDFMYVHHAHQGEGVGAGLLGHIELEARRSNAVQLRAEVSITAKPFFEKHGFGVIQEQMVVRQNVALTNFLMVKIL